MGSTNTGGQYLLPLDIGMSGGQLRQTHADHPHGNVEKPPTFPFSAIAHFLLTVKVELHYTRSTTCSSQK